MDWLTLHCAARFDVVPSPSRLFDEWGFDAAGLVRQGLGCRTDARKAAGWYRRAAAQGHAEAQYCLALALRHGRGHAREVRNDGARQMAAIEGVRDTSTMTEFDRDA